ncbi:hypothetical protein PPUJ20066_11460 [Pseudomonas putida]|nr:hypothetical protein PPUJ20066_11460 [Pseudomonas putida]
MVPSARLRNETPSSVNWLTTSTPPFMAAATPTIITRGAERNDNQAVTEIEASNPRQVSAPAMTDMEIAEKAWNQLAAAKDTPTLCRKLLLNITTDVDNEAQTIRKPVKYEAATTRCGKRPSASPT